MRFAKYNPNMPVGPRPGMRSAGVGRITRGDGVAWMWEVWSDTDLNLYPLLTVIPEGAALGT